MSRISAADAGRKGGLSRSAKKLAAARRNGFQKMDRDTPPDIPPVIFTKPVPTKTVVLLGAK